MIIKYLQSLFEIIENSNMSLKEKKFRRQRLICSYKDLKNKTGSSFYTFTHEIKSLNFLCKYDDVKINEDSKSVPGCDYIYKEKYQIECVCSSGGNIIENGLCHFRGSGIFDGNKKETILLTRLTSSLLDKKRKYETDVINNYINKNKPYIIFLSLGELREKYPRPHKYYGFMLNKILMGVDHPFISLDMQTGKRGEEGFTYKKEIIKHNDSSVPCNIFKNQEYSNISAILYTNARSLEEYNSDNTFLFINPFAKNKVKIKDFKGITYWNFNQEGFYVPRKNGKILESEINKEFFDKIM